MTPLRQRMLEDMQVRAAVAGHARDVCPSGCAVRPPFRPLAGASGSRGDSRLPGPPDARTPSRAELAGRRRVGAPVPLSRHAQKRWTSTR